MGPPALRRRQSSLRRLRDSFARKKFSFSSEPEILDIEKPLPLPPTARPPRPPRPSAVLRSQDVSRALSDGGIRSSTGSTSTVKTRFIPAASSLAGLPNELLDNIFTDLSRRDVLSTSLSCHRLFTAAEPHLCRHLHLRGAHSGLSPQLQRVLSTPRLRSSVRHITYFASRSEPPQPSLSTVVRKLKNVTEVTYHPDQFSFEPIDRELVSLNHVSGRDPPLIHCPEPLKRLPLRFDVLGKNIGSLNIHISDPADGADNVLLTAYMQSPNVRLEHLTLHYDQAALTGSGHHSMGMGYALPYPEGARTRKVPLKTLSITGATYLNSRYGAEIFSYISTKHLVSLTIQEFHANYPTHFPVLERLVVKRLDESAKLFKLLRAVPKSQIRELALGVRRSVGWRYFDALMDFLATELPGIERLAVHRPVYAREMPRQVQPEVLRKMARCCGKLKYLALPLPSNLGWPVEHLQILRDEFPRLMELAISFEAGVGKGASILSTVNWGAAETIKAFLPRALERLLVAKEVAWEKGRNNGWVHFEMGGGKGLLEDLGDWRVPVRRARSEDVAKSLRVYAGGDRSVLVDVSCPDIPPDPRPKIIGRWMWPRPKREAREREERGSKARWKRWRRAPPREYDWDAETDPLWL